MTGPDLEQREQDAPAEQAAAADAPAVAAAPRRSLTTALAVTAALLLVVLGLLLWQLSRDAGPQAPAAVRAEAREEIRRAAGQAALNLTSIDHREFDRDVQRVLETATGAFRTDFEGRASDLREVLTENQVVSEGELVEAAVAELDGDRATALVVVDSNVSNTAVPEGRVNTYRMKLELERVDGQWLTSMLEFVG